MKIAYEDWNASLASLAMVAKANEIVAEYAAQGFDLTLRQLYYQFVSRDLLANKQTEYKRLGDIVSKARRAGMLDWDAIVDRTRELRRVATFDSPESILDVAAKQYITDPWRSQVNHVEVWFEKDALLGVFERPAREWRLPYFSCRGYASDSEVWSAAQRLARIGRAKARVVILHFGDHDPSGLDMTRDITDRLLLFGAPRRLEVRRVALTFDQIEQYNPPPNPAKDTDSRISGYRERYGDESWELDALDPATLAGLVRQHVEGLIANQEKWDASMATEKQERAVLRAISGSYERIREELLPEIDAEDEVGEEPEE